VRREPLKSSTIGSAGYDAALATLELEFVSGEVYQYFAVPERHFVALMAAESPGAYFNQHIRDHFPWTSV
jgi:hypothetical protein